MIARLRAAAAHLAPDQRLAGALALGLFATMFLPWYSRSVAAVTRQGLERTSDTLNAFQVFTFVEAAVLLVVVAVCALLFARGERRAFHLPGGDGTVIAAAGLWVCLLVFYRQFDQPEPDRVSGVVADTGVSWGIFVTFLLAGGLAYAGVRIRQAHLAEPPLPGEGPAGPPAPRTGGSPAPVARRIPREPRTRDLADEPTRRVRADETTTRVAPRADRPDIDGGTQLSFDEQE